LELWLEFHFGACLAEIHLQGFLEKHIFFLQLFLLLLQREDLHFIVQLDDRDKHLQFVAEETECLHIILCELQFVPVILVFDRCPFQLMVRQPEEEPTLLLKDAILRKSHFLGIFMVLVENNQGATRKDDGAFLVSENPLDFIVECPFEVHRLK
jgi:hypothetical protein